MDKQAKLKELEARQRQIADEIRQVREAPELELKVGSYYKTRAGAVVGPVRKRASYLEYPYKTDENTYVPNGQVYFAFQCEEDLVEEVPAPQSSSIPPKGFRLLGDDEIVPRVRGLKFFASWGTWESVIGTPCSAGDTQSESRWVYAVPESMSDQTPKPKLNLRENVWFVTRGGDVVRLVPNPGVTDPTEWPWLIIAPRSVSDDLTVDKHGSQSVDHLPGAKHDIISEYEGSDHEPKTGDVYEILLGTGVTNRCLLTDTGLNIHLTPRPGVRGTMPHMDFRNNPEAKYLGTFQEVYG